MKRRDLLKTAGTMMLAAPAVRASALMKSDSEPTAQGQSKNLIVAFSGAFCFWQESDRFTVMFPPVGGDPDPHRPWAGTTANEKAFLPDEKALRANEKGRLGFPEFRLSTGDLTTASGDPLQHSSGTKYFFYEQGSGVGESPMLNLFVPIPNQIIGVRPTGARMYRESKESKEGTADSSQYKIYASGLSFVYQNVNLERIKITREYENRHEDFYNPCFLNDQALTEATLTIHLTPLKRVLDPGHDHAKRVWRRMCSMYSWMTENDIAFCKFDPSTCPASCSPMPVGGGPSDDCQVPIMVLPQKR